MADVVYVGAGTYAAGNNASVTPGLPSGLAVGDLLVVFATIRSTTASVDTPGGWNAGPQGAASGSYPISSKWRLYQSGDSAPTVSFTGGGTNNTTQAIILAFRGTHTASPLYTTAELGISPNPTSIASGVAGSWPWSGGGSGVLAIGDYAVGVRTAGNDIAEPSGSSWVGASGTATIWNNSNLGTDAALGVYRGLCTASTCTTTVGADATIASALHAFGIRKAPNVYSYSGSGGAIGGGAATTSKRDAVHSYVATGGSTVGGTAAYEVHHAVHAYTGSGGVSLGGAAQAEPHYVLRLYTGVGGSKIGGVAATAYLQPTYYYIDPFAGSDSHGGLSWVDAFKTFTPISSRSVVPLPGDVIKVAKTPDPVDTGVSFTTMKLSGHYIEAPTTRNTFGEEAIVSYQAPTVISGNTTVVLDTSVDVGWTNGTLSSRGLASIQDARRTPRMSIVDTGNHPTNTVIAYAATGATRNLSGYSRIEWPISVRFASNVASRTTPPIWKLCLCSDAAGATTLLEIPFPMYGNPSNIVSYEGALPDGVNSIALKVGTQLGWAVAVYIGTLIATKSYSSSNYYGWFTLARIGSHDGSYYQAIDSFLLISSVLYIKLALCLVGPVSAHNTTMGVYLRKAAGWCSLGVGTTFTNAAGTAVTASAQTLDYCKDAGLRPSFDLAGMVGAEGSHIIIEGGYDTATDTVTGVTCILGFTNSYYATTHNYPSFALQGTSNITIKNIDEYNTGCGILGVGGANANVHFENCTLMSSKYEYSTSAYYASAATIQSVESDTSWSLTGLRFTNCRGQIDPSTTREVRRYFVPVTSLGTVTYDDCDMYPYAHKYATSQGNSYTFSGAYAEVIGTLRIYPVAAPTNRSTYQAMVALPGFVSGSAGTVKVYRGGIVRVQAAVLPSETGTEYVFPALELYNTEVELIDTRQMALASAYGGGHPSAIRFPQVAIVWSASPYCRDADAYASSYYPRYLFYFTYLVGSSYPPVRIQNIAISGAGEVSQSVAVLHEPSGYISVENLSNTATNFSLVPHYAGSTVGSNREVGAINGDVAIFNSCAFGICTLPAATYAALANVVGGVVEYRSCSISWSGAYQPTRPVDSVTGQLRILSCNFTKANGTKLFASRPSGEYASYSSSALADTSGVLIQGHDATQLSPGWAVTEATGEFTVEATTAQVTEVLNSGAHVAYPWYGSLSKDTSTYVSSTFSWKNTLGFNTMFPLSVRIPLASLPLKYAKSVTFKIWLRRASTVNNYIALVVDHYGAAGYATDDDYREKITLGTASANVWEQVSIAFTVQRSELVDVYITHYGASGSVAWFDSLEVVEL